MSRKSNDQRDIQRGVRVMLYRYIQETHELEIPQTTAHQLNNFIC